MLSQNDTSTKPNYTHNKGLLKFIFKISQFGSCFLWLKIEENNKRFEINARSTDVCTEYRVSGQKCSQQDAGKSRKLICC